MNKKKLTIIVITVLVVVSAAVFFLTRGALSIAVKSDGVYVSASKTAQLQKAFKKYDYDMIHHLEGKAPVPRLFVKSVPADFNAEKYDEVRPALFYEMLLPVILKANEQLAAQRAEVMALKKEFDETGDLSDTSVEKLGEWVKRYDVKPSDDISTVFESVLMRVDAVTPTIMLATAAQDSGFATSRYAREYNAIYHQRDWDGNGVVPDEAQKEGPQYRIKVFDSLYDAVVSQMYYLNTNGYFENYRIARAKYRRSDNPMRGYSVAHLLINFPYKTYKYPDIIKYLIEQYGLMPLDFLPLEPVKE